MGRDRRWHRPLHDKLWDEIVKGTYDECWPWIGRLARGYGQVWHEGKYMRCHVESYIEAYGPVPEGCVVDHECHNEAVRQGTCAGGECIHRTCCNPAHLIARPQGDNLRSSPLTQASINSAKTHCVRGHEYTPENTMTRTSGFRGCLECQKENNAKH